MSYDNMSSVSQNVLKFYQQLTGEERRILFIFEDFHFCCSRVIGLDTFYFWSPSLARKMRKTNVRYYPEYPSRSWHPILAP